MKDAEVYKQKIKLLEDELALTPVEAAAIIGCRDRDLRDFMQPSFRVNGRPKYIRKEVLAVRDRMVDASDRMNDRSVQMLRKSAA